VVAVTTTDPEKQKRRVRAAYFAELEKKVGPWGRRRLYELEVLDNGMCPFPSFWEVRSADCPTPVR